LGENQFVRSLAQSAKQTRQRLQLGRNKGQDPARATIRIPAAMHKTFLPFSSQPEYRRTT